MTKIITGQYVHIEHTLANIGARILARFIDFLLIIIYSFAVFYSISYFVSEFNFSENLYILLYVLFLSLPMFYSLFWELFNKGQTPGKKLLGIRAVMIDGKEARLSSFILRWLMLIVDIYFFQCIGILSIMFTKNNQRLGDLAAGTIVIKEKDYRKIKVNLDEFQHLGLNYTPVFPHAENLSDEQINIINQTLSLIDKGHQARVAELASKVKEFLQIKTEMKDIELLRTLVKDYLYYSFEEV